MRHLLMHVPGFLGGMILISLSSSHAIIRSWDDGGFGDTWNLVNNWSPNGNPGGDDLFIGDLPQGAGEQTIVNFDFTIESLTITNGASADTDGNRLIVNGLTSIAGANTELRIRDDASSGAALLTETLFIGSGATAEMYDDSEVVVGNGALTNFGTIQGNGGLRLLDNPASPTSLFTNSGTLSVGQPNFVLNPPARTLAITGIDVDARVDLDGSGNGVVSLQSNATLDLDVPLLDPFSGDINLGPNSTLDVQSNWQVDGNINVNSSFLTLVQEATIAGGLLSLNSGATVTLDETDEVLRFAATLSANNGSTLANSGTVIFDAPAQFGATANFNLLGSAGSMVVNSQKVEILQDSFDIDGDGQLTNQVTVNAGAQLIFNGGNFGGGFNDLKADGVININGGDIIMDPVGNWTMDGTLNMNGTVNNQATLRLNSGLTTSQSVFIGDGVGTSDANLVVGGDGTSLILYRSITFGNDADVDIAAGAVLSLGGFVFFNGSDATFDGEGTLRASLMRVNAATTLNIAVVDLGEAGSHIVNAPLTINADAIDDDGSGFSGEISVTPSGRVTVNVPGGWQFDSGTITIDSGAASSGVDLLNGSPVDLGVEGGTLVALGRGPRINARVSLFGPVSIPNLDDALILGGNHILSPHRIEGGTVGGNGELQLINSSLYGFGTILTDLGIFSVPASTEEVVMADDGTLTISGNITGLDGLGVSDDGVLNVTNPWNTNNLNGSVFLEGGEITGATITHNNVGSRISGNGLISAPLINNQSIWAEGGGTLVLDPTTGVNDYDGATNNGQLRAFTANLVLRNDNIGGNQTTDSLIGVSSGQEVFVDGFRLDYSLSSQLWITEGIYRINEGASVRGSVRITGSTPSRIVNEGTQFFIFHSTSTSDLDANLELENTRAAIVVGATFTGLGSLVVLEGSELKPQDSATVAVSIVNQGIYDSGTISDSLVASTTVGGFTQSSTGELIVNISGVAPGTFDVLTVSNNAVLDGTLDIDLYNGFLPILGNSFTILETTFGNVGGMFAVEDFPVFNGLTFDVIYNSQNVVLQVVEATFEADFDNDGDVDGDDLTQWEGDFGGPGSDADGDGDSDGADFLIWQQQFGGGVSEITVSQPVPEPSTLMLLCGASFFSRKAFRSRRARNPS